MAAGLLVLILAAGGTAAPSAGAAEAAKPAAAAAAPARDPNALICHSEPGVGTRMTVKVCVKAADLKARSQQDRRDLDGAQRAYQPPPTEMMMAPR
jgi:hypothetical protein